MTQETQGRNRDRCIATAERIADTIGHSGYRRIQVDGRNDMVGFQALDAITPARVYAKRGVEENNYVWNRIHVVVPGSNIQGNRWIETARRCGMDIVDVWTNNQDMQAENCLDPHREHANIRIAFEYRK